MPNSIPLMAPREYDGFLEGLKVVLIHSVRSPTAKLPPCRTPEVQSPFPLTLFLQYKSETKKYVLPEGFTSLSPERLQRAFIELNTPYNGVDFSKIYIQHPTC